MNLKFTLVTLIFLERVCYILGCYPNVVGADCDKCEENYWNIRSGKGCEPCDCDRVGSKHPQCNEDSGDCDCNENFGGRRCNECKANYWGDPKADTCIKCQCNLETEQCDRNTGICKCGECFNKWNKTLIDFEHEINKLKDRNNVTAEAAYTKEFNLIENTLNDIEDLLNQPPKNDLNLVEGELDSLRELINKTERGELKHLNEILANATSEVANMTLQNFKNKIDLLRNKADELMANGTKLQERNVEDALDIIKNVKTKADDAAKSATNTQDIIKNIESRCKSTESKSNSTKHEEDVASLKNLTELIKNLNDSLPKLNKLICDGSEYPCDNTCGGTTCNGTKNQAKNANSLSINTEALYNDKKKLLNEYITNLRSINGTLLKNQTIFAFNKSLEAKNEASDMTDKVNDKLAKIDEFMKQSNPIPKEIQDKIDNKTKNFKWEPEDIEEFALNIKETADSLTNVEPIRAETEKNLSVAKKLKEDADDAKKQVDDIKNIVNNIENFLKNTEIIQTETETKIGNISQSFDNITIHLDNIDKLTNETQQQFETTSKNIETLNKELAGLKKLLGSNLFAAQSLKNESINIKTKTEQTMHKLNGLLNNYDEAKTKLNASIERVNKSKARAKNLVNRTLNLSLNVEAKQESISKLITPPNNKLNSIEEQLNQLISDMDKHTEDIETIADHFKFCNTKNITTQSE
ncbi:laminin subunit beta-1-like [Onthophagus taurus]|uniref:laminin subunit beta-1-like n=1 Tax=Onthophagus taurus TaxID=166361 RepID=UPI0039BE4C06